MNMVLVLEAKLAMSADWPVPPTIQAIEIGAFGTKGTGNVSATAGLMEGLVPAVTVNSQRFWSPDTTDTDAPVPQPVSVKLVAVTVAPIKYLSYQKLECTCSLLAVNPDR
jgi:hypothetical protein